MKSLLLFGSAIPFPAFYLNSELATALSTRIVRLDFIADAWRDPDKLHSDWLKLRYGMNDFS